MLTRFVTSTKAVIVFFASTAWFLFWACSGPENEASVVAHDSLVSKLKLPPGFVSEILYNPSEDSNGSWVSMAFDRKGRLITSDQYGGLYRMEVPAIGTDSVIHKTSVIALPFDMSNGDSALQHKIQMGYAQGLVWAFNSLYVVVNHKRDSAFQKESGLYRLQDLDGNDRFDKVTLLKTLVGEEEHGPHSIKLSPDGKSLYVVAGNHTQLPKGIANYTLPPVWQADNILPSHFELDPRTAPAGGWVAKVDSSGSVWELISAGLRNTFDVAFNEAGDLFTYDSDMEWDIGMPWYRPTRVCHITSGSEWGWRDAEAKWSPDYLDNLPPLLNIGQGSPTNIMSLHGARFPQNYANTLLAFDWSFGIIYALHLKAAGASYTAQGEEFISGAPLPLTDGVVGPDGALYFLTGGRRLESRLYRVSYKNGNEAVLEGVQNRTPENSLRRTLEAFHTTPNSAALSAAWPHLNHPDRFVRYAARIAVEHQPVAQWQEKVLLEEDATTCINAATALARQGSKPIKEKLLDALLAIKYSSLAPSLQADLLRAYEIIFARMGRPNKFQTAKLISSLSPHYPAATNNINRQLSKVLAFINDPSVVEKTLNLLDQAADDASDQATFANSADLILRNPQYGMDLAGVESNTPPAQQIFYAIVLSDIKTGWTPTLRERYYSWFHKAYGYKGGRFYVGYLDKARASALKSVPRNAYKHFDTLSTNTASKGEVIDWVRIMSDGGPGRQWKLKDAVDTVENLSGRNYKEAKAMFTAAACINCHAVRGEGGAVGPDLTQLGTRFSKKDILEAIIEPNKTISDQYVSTVFALKNGKSLMGKLVKEDAQAYYISQNPFAPQALRTLDKKTVSGTRNAEVSLMPPALINQMNPERLRDLVAYLISGGNPQHPVFIDSTNTAKK